MYTNSSQIVFLRNYRPFEVLINLYRFAYFFYVSKKLNLFDIEVLSLTSYTVLQKIILSFFNKIYSNAFFYRNTHFRMY